MPSRMQAGLLGLTKTVAKELATRNIVCNAIAPGFIASDMTAKIDKKYEEAILKLIPLGVLNGNPNCRQAGRQAGAHACIPLTPACMQHAMARQRRLLGSCATSPWTQAQHTSLARH